MLAKQNLLGQRNKLSMVAGDLNSRHRVNWFTARRSIESSGRKHTVKRTYQNAGNPIDYFIPLFSIVLKTIGVFKAGLRNALAVRLSEEEIVFPNLPASFDGFRILHISDPHFGNLPEIEKIGNSLITGLTVDLIVITGDLQSVIESEPDSTVEPLQQLLNGVVCRDGIIATLGNHDCADLTTILEQHGVLVLANETALVTRGPSQLALTGTDDVSRFYSPAATDALRQAPQCFRIALIHSPELAEVAAEAGFSMYLCGHTHGGQICLPGGSPIFTGVDVHREFARGHWRCGNMRGYTNTGLGTGVLPIRFHCPPEILLLTLRKSQTV